MRIAALTHASAKSTTFTPTRAALLQRECSCGAKAEAGGECAECRKKRENTLQRLAGAESGVGHNFGRVSVGPQPRLAINQPGDRFEQEADRIADFVVNGGARSPTALSPAAFASVQREDKAPPAPPKPNNYDEAAKKILDALQKTEIAKQLKAKAEELGKDFVSSVEGKVIAGSALGGALAAIIATNSELPVPIPELPLDFIAPGLKAKLTWDGPVRSPTNVGLTLTSRSGVSLSASYTSKPASPGKLADERAGLTLSIPFGGSPAKRKSKTTGSEKYRAETARLAADQSKFKEGFKTVDQRADDKAFWDSYWRSKLKDPLNPLALPNLGTKPAESKKDDDDLLLMRQAATESAPINAPPIVHDVLAESGQPLNAQTRDFMESRFGHDFSHVRVHTDSRADESAKSVNALAYAVGSHVVFAGGQYQPGSAAGQRLIAHELAHTIQQGAAIPSLQRYTVPASLACSEVVDWLNSSSPYAPEWAETRCNYSFNGNVGVSTSTLPDGTVKADVKGNDKLTVSVSCPIDRPQWNPTARSNRAAEVAAWNSMRASLDAHESAHRTIGQTWKTTLQSNFRAVNFSVTGADRAEAMANATTELNSQQQQWIADAQAAQDAIDPFRGAVLSCPAAPNPSP